MWKRNNNLLFDGSYLSNTQTHQQLGKPKIMTCTNHTPPLKPHQLFDDSMTKVNYAVFPNLVSSMIINFYDAGSGRFNTKILLTLLSSIS